MYSVAYSWALQAGHCQLVGRAFVRNGSGRVAALCLNFYWVPFADQQIKNKREQDRRPNL